MRITLSSLIAGLCMLTVIVSCDSRNVYVNPAMRIMSYNLRFDNPDDGKNIWDNRKERVSNLIAFYNPVFLGTQEGLLHQVEYLEETLDKYRWIGVGRDDGTMNGEFSALFYDTLRVELVNESDTTIWLSETPDIPGSKGWDAVLPRILTYGRFRDRGTGEEFFVLNTHFDHIGDTARAKSAELIIRTIARIADDEPVVLTGDFNATPVSDPYINLTEKNYGLNDAFEVAELPHVGPLFTFEGFEVKSSIERRRIDYIFVNDRVKVKRHAINSTFRDLYYPSDHLPVIADITFTE